MVIYHGNKRETSIEELKQADVVLTTYSIVENEFRKNCLPDKVACAYCNKKFFPDRLKVHLRWALPFSSLGMTAALRHAHKASALCSDKAICQQALIAGQVKDDCPKWLKAARVAVGRVALPKLTATQRLSDVACSGTRLVCSCCHATVLLAAFAKHFFLYLLCWTRVWAVS